MNFVAQDRFATWKECSGTNTHAHYDNDGYDDDDNRQMRNNFFAGSFCHLERVQWTT